MRTQEIMRCQNCGCDNAAPELPCGGCGATLKEADPIHCTICNQKAPTKAGYSHMSFSVAMLIPNPNGWARMFYPWDEVRMSSGAALVEQQWICPPCSVEVAKFIAHRRQPMRTEYENL